MEGQRNRDEAAVLDSARKAFQRYHALCFWDFADDFEITEATIPLIVRRLRSGGNRETYRVAADLCH